MKIHLKGSIFLFAIFFSCSVSLVRAQNSAGNNPPVEKLKRSNCTQLEVVTALPKAESNVAFVEDNQEHPFGGTFQLIQKKGQRQEIFTTDLLDFIEKNRSETEEKTVAISSHTKVRIPSKRQIGSKDFKPFANLYSYE